MAGGKGSRLEHCTRVTSKHLLPVYDKPLIYYSMTLFVQAGVRDVLLISDKASLWQYQTLFKGGVDMGLRIAYAPQQEPRGIAEGFRIASDLQFDAQDDVMLVLGDNILHGARLGEHLLAHCSHLAPCVFGYPVSDPHEYGVIEIDESHNIVSIEEKPSEPKSNMAVIGLYLYPPDVYDVAASLQPSARGEFEITDVNRHYLEAGRLHCELLSVGYAWFDCGNADAMLDASNYVRAVQSRCNVRIGDPYETARRLGRISP
jgi:glucose-1-phosphate thymidylyltransferase